MPSEVFHAVFSVHFDVHYDTSNESSWRWWVNENICMTLLCQHTYTVICHSHVLHGMRDTTPTMLLWIMEEFFYISQQLTDEDHDGCIVLGL